MNNIDQVLFIQNVLNVVTHRVLPVITFPDSKSVNRNYGTVQTSTIPVSKMVTWRQRFPHNNVIQLLSIARYILLKKLQFVSMFLNFHWFDNYFSKGLTIFSFRWNWRVCNANIRYIRCELFLQLRIGRLQSLLFTEKWNIILIIHLMICYNVKLLINIQICVNTWENQCD